MGSVRVKDQDPPPSLLLWYPLSPFAALCITLPQNRGNISANIIAVTTVVKQVPAPGCRDARHSLAPMASPEAAADGIMLRAQSVGLLVKG